MRAGPGPQCAQDAARVRASAFFDPAWYAQRHPEACAAPGDAAAYYAAHGAAAGHDPGPCFSAAGYLAANPDVAAAGVPAFLHYLRSGHAEGRALHPGAAPGVRLDEVAEAQHQRALMDCAGLEGAPAAALARIAGGAGDAAALAAEALAVQALHRGAAGTARRWLARREAIGGTGTRLLPLRLIAAARDGDAAAAQELAETARSAARTAPPGRAAGLHLAALWAGAPEAGAALAAINAALAAAGAAPVTLADDGPTVFDRIAAPPAPHGAGAPRITVLMAARNAEKTIGTAIASVLAQTGVALELLVIDDASTDATAEIAARAAQGDPRLRLIRQQAPGGAYAARNAGLAQARGDWVTLHDADDWAHPERLARQMAALEARPALAGCLTLQARVDEALRPQRWTGAGEVVFENISSVLLPRALLQGPLGGWDAGLRAGADAELLRRVRRLAGAGAVPVLEEAGLMALQRAHAASATGDSATGMGWCYTGARLAYFEAQSAHHAATPLGAAGWAGPLTMQGARPYAVPRLLRAGAQAEAPPLDRVYAGDLTASGKGVESLLGHLAEDAATGRCVGLVRLYPEALPTGGGIALHPALRAALDTAARERPDAPALREVTFGESVDCARLIVIDATPTGGQRYLPEVSEQGTPRLTPAAPEPLPKP